MTVSESVGPILAEVLRNKLTSVVREASTALYRAAFSTIVREMKDFSSSLHDARGGLVTQAEGIPIFLGAMSHPLEALLQRYAVDEMEKGDIFISNDPYRGGGTHKNDINIMMPYFVGDEVVLFFISKIHWMDVGGKAPGSWAPDATDAFQEGLAIPPVRLFSRGKLVADIEDLIIYNTRLASLNRGDYSAQLAACFTARKRLDELFREYSWATVAAAMDLLRDQTEFAMRERISAIPNGTYRGLDHVDSDGVVDEIIPVDVEVRVEDDTLTVDFSHCPSQSRGACGNSSLPRTASAVRVALRALLAPDLPANEGLFAPIRIVAPEGSIVNPRPPAPVTLGNLVARAVLEAILIAFADLAPERVMAGQFGSTFAIVFSGKRARDDGTFIFLQVAGGGWGAKQESDGVNAITSFSNGHFADCPVEVLETKYPLLVESYALRVDSAGDGRHRGGLGVQQDFRVLEDGVTLSASLDRYRIAPPGIMGGQPGACNRIVITENGKQTTHSLLAGLSVSAGAVVSQQTGGGGGFGPPEERADELIEEDLRQGYVSPERARAAYGGMKRREASGDV